MKKKKRHNKRIYGYNFKQFNSGANILNNCFHLYLCGFSYIISV